MGRRQGQIPGHVRDQRTLYAGECFLTRKSHGSPGALSKAGTLTNFLNNLEIIETIQQRCS